ncbi:MAG TPA: radical SAM protein [Bacillota bacterium]|nr:radical SAM protein [Bacillota bacterium]HOK68291.1 radical SAM protein [Bacillota bacterium]HPP84505.1 radical SAM protein [Bacillota bacterium]
MLLVYPDYTDRDMKGKTTGGSYSEGLASISAVLKQSGHSVSLLHLLYLHDEEEYKQKLREKGEFDIIGFSVRTTAFPDVKTYIKWTKEVYPDVFIICGGYHCTLVPGEVLAVDGVDAVCIGDGEYAQLELCDKMSAGEDYWNVESLWFKNEDGSFIKNPVRPLFADLDRLPIPDFDLFDYKNLDSVKVDTAIVMMSRGCFYNCTYCGNSQFRNVYPNKKIYARFRSPENAILYLKTLLSKYPNIKFINFRDAIFNMFPDWFDKFIELYKKEIHLPFTCNVRFDILTEDTVRRMKEAGCYTIDMGLESGDQEIRFKYLKRYMTDEMVINCSKWFHKYGIDQLTYNIIGLPYEDIHKALKTIKLNARMKSDRYIPNIFYPYPGTALYDIAKKAGFLPDVIPPGCRVPLKQEQFPEEQVLFIEAYFGHFVRRYKLAYALPSWLGKPYEKWLDHRVTGKHVPYKFYVKVHDIYAKARNKLKDFLIDRLPKLYIKLRVLKHKKRAKK